MLDEVARELGVTRSEVVLAWLVGGDPVVRPVAGVSSMAQVEAALSGVRLTLPPEVRERLDAPW
ncbi:aldo/keto reductase [Cellulomonas sp. P22]|uniref:aldo/keto reductase n=1 Tax=Cellulomonas sp. P22 TaxID=3373189 RepID=UPI00379068E5